MQRFSLSPRGHHTDAAALASVVTEPAEINPGLLSGRTRNRAFIARFLCILCWTLLFPNAAAAQIEDVKLGIENQVRLGEWAAVSLKLGNQLASAAVARMEIETIDGDGVPAIYEQAPLIDASDERRLVGWFRLGATKGDVRIRLLDSTGKELAQSAFGVSSTPNESTVTVLPLTARLIVVVGVAPEARPLFNWANNRGEEFKLIFLDSVSSLPPTALGLRNLDTLVLAATEPGQLELLNSQRTNAIQSWVRWGGKLVIWTAAETSADFSPTAKFGGLVPGELTGFEPLDGVSRLDFLLKAKKPLVALGDAGVPVARLRTPQGQVMVSQEDVPLVIRQQFGLGQVTFSALSIDKEPMRSWEATPRLLDAILTQANLSEERAPDARSTVTNGMYRDLSEQLRIPLEGFSRVSLISFTTVALLISLLILLAGPGDYFLLRNLPGRRMELTWLTFPLLILGFCGLSYWLANRSYPNQLQYNQFEVVDLDVRTGQLRGTNWTSLYSPKAGVHDVKGSLGNRIPAKLFDEQTSWLALPGGAMGGNIGSGQSRYRHFAEASGDDIKVSLLGFPFPVRSTKTLVYQWSGQSELKVRSQLQLDTGIGRLSGTITNPFDFPLRNCRIYYEGWAYLFDQPLEAGDTVDLLTEARERTVKSILTQRDRVSSEGKTQNAPWDLGEEDPLRILEMMMFHDSAGGQSYTGLVNRAHWHLEMSEHLDLKQAIFVAELPESVSRLELDGQPLKEGVDKRHSFIRLSVPLRNEEKSDKSAPKP
ncbi:MAG: hypothetical protein ACKO81_01425 [Planctomycetota bacterium]